MGDLTSGYPARWEADAVLADGGTVHVRPIRPGDAPLIEALHGRLSEQTVYLRFFTPLPRLSPGMLQRFTTVDYVDRMALVAVLGGDIIGVARYDRVPGTTDAEVAFVVEDAHQGRGVGSLLLEHLAAIARENGVRRFVAETLATNDRMLRVFRDAGFGDERRFEGGVIRVSFTIEPTDSSVAAMHERERLAAARSVQRLLAPTSIAVVGAGRQRGNLGHEVFRNLLAAGFQGPVYPVHPTAGHVASVRAYPTVLDVPDAVDVAVVAVPSDQVLEVVQQCGRKHVHGLIVISDGFAETGPEGAALERRIVEQARAAGMRLIGPNSMGALNTAQTVRMNATVAPIDVAPGRIGFMSQSGALGVAILEEARTRDLGISSFVAAGNKADVSGNDVLQYWEEDAGTEVALFYLQSFGNPRTFSRVARRVSRRKPIIAVKSGRHDGRDAAVEALFRQTGVLRVDSLEQLFDVAQALVSQPLPQGRRVGIVGNAGGPGVMAVDACENLGLEVPELGPATQQALRSLLPSALVTSNPVNLSSKASAADYEEAVRLVLADEGVDAVVVIFFPPHLVAVDEVARAVSAAAGGSTKPVLATILGRRVLPALGTGTIPAFPYPESVALVLARMADRAEWLRRPPGKVPELGGVDEKAARLLVSTALLEYPAGLRLDPGSAAQLVTYYGMAVAPSVHVGSAEEAVAEAARIGFPVALKAGGVELRRETRGVVLDVTSPEQVRRAFEEMHAALGEAMGGMVVQQMVKAGVETSVSVTQDPSFGPIVTFGMGGMAVELLKDRASRVLPLTDVDAAELVRSVRGAPLLFGYRGRPAVDVEALEELLLRLSTLVEEVPEVAEVSLDPLIVSPRGAVAVGVEVALAPWEPRPELALRRLR